MPCGYCTLRAWHHNQDGKTVQLVPNSMHNAPMGGFSHAGGVSVIKG
ncbi:MAG: HNH endonuclease [Uliginosibacterium sp.]|nr:HNH endonuclease [Uliginosibacterium sp.]MBK9394483.1 HNH endonuclease [Uliginosibacterium sp.]MBK9616367.1 HNH endonuclease [Uliginosibacterium sp.]